MAGVARPLRAECMRKPRSWKGKAGAIREDDEDDEDAVGDGDDEDDEDDEGL